MTDHLSTIQQALDAVEAAKKRHAFVAYVLEETAAEDLAVALAACDALEAERREAAKRIEEAEGWRRVGPESRPERAKAAEAEVARLRTLLEMLEYDDATIPAPIAWPGRDVVRAALAGGDKCPCGANANDHIFDRSICGCGAAHYYCAKCGNLAVGETCSLAGGV